MRVVDDVVAARRALVFGVLAVVAAVTVGFSVGDASASSPTPSSPSCPRSRPTPRTNRFFPVWPKRFMPCTA